MHVPPQAQSPSPPPSAAGRGAQVAGLLTRLDPQVLTEAAPQLSSWQLGLVDNADAVAALMVHGGPLPQSSKHGLATQDSRPEASYWDAIKQEMHLFLCTDDARYSELWGRIDRLENKTTTTLVGLIASALGATIGVAATLVAGFIAVCLYALAKVGKEAYCTYTTPAPQPAAAA